MSKTVTRPHLCLCHSVKNLPAKQLRIIRAIAPATGEKETPNPALLPSHLYRRCRMRGSGHVRLGGKADMAIALRNVR
jgi:hypothetical protein